LTSGAMYREAPGSESTLTVLDLNAPTYPAMAKAARVSGEVDLSINLAKDGSPARVIVDSGPPMLRQAAIDSATRFHFQAKLESATGVYRVIYRFVLETTGKCDEERDSSYPQVKHESNVITVAEQPALLCDPVAVIQTIRFRSVKCLYLWKCDSRAP